MNMPATNIEARTAGDVTRRLVELRVVCPSCRGELREEAERITCLNCGAAFGFCGEFPDLVLGDRFDDPTDEAQMIYEEQANADTTENYWLPRFRQIWPSNSEPARLLSLGCGTGVDVDMLAAAGFDCVGVDCGNRMRAWTRRQRRERLLLANGKHLPFESESFDGVFCGCVFPHVGVVGDSHSVRPDYGAERAALAREIARALKPGGHIFVSSPNRWFPLDIFHGRAAGSHQPRPYCFRDPFLLSRADYSRLFAPAGCARAEAQPVRGYWGFVRSRGSLKGRLLSWPVRLLFNFVSSPGLGALRASPLNPWLVVMITKKARRGAGVQSRKEEA